MSSQKRIGQYCFNMVQVLGKGAYGQVYLGLHINSRQKVAIKVISLNTISQQIRGRFQQIHSSEIRNMQLVNSPHIVKLIDVQISKNNLYLICQFCNGGDLQKYLHKKKRLSQQEAFKFFRQILQGFECLYDNKIVHRDLKPGNIMLHNYSVKIGDFGFSKLINDIDQTLNSFVGTPQYMSPQILERLPYTTKADIWSLGTIFFQMLYGILPWQTNSNSNQTFDQIHKIKTQPLKFPNFPKVSETIKELLRKMLEIKQENRIEWNDLFAIKKEFSQDTYSEQRLKQSLKQIKAMVNSHIGNDGISWIHKNIFFKKNDSITKDRVNMQLAQLYFKINKVVSTIQQCFKNVKQNSHFFGTNNQFQIQSQFNSEKDSLFLQLVDQNNHLKKLPCLQKVAHYFLNTRNKAAYLIHLYFKLLENIFNRKVITQTMKLDGFLFILIKKANRKLYKIYKLLVQQDINIYKFTKQEMRIFKNSRQGQEVTKLCKADYTICSLLLKVQLERNKLRGFRMGQNEDWIRLQKSLNQNYEDKNLKIIFKEYKREILKQLLENKNKQQIQILRIIVYLFQYFNYKQKNNKLDNTKVKIFSPECDLFKVYEDIDKADIQHLNQYLKALQL